MENTSNIQTVKEVADILRCSKAHVHNAIQGKWAACRSLRISLWGAANSFGEIGWSSGSMPTRPANAGE